MSHFYSEIQGNRGEATRCGSADSGIRGHIRGWHSGGRVYGHVNRDGEDQFSIYATKGSSGYGGDTLLATVTDEKIILNHSIEKLIWDEEYKQLVDKLAERIHNATDCKLSFSESEHVAKEVLTELNYIEDKPDPEPELDVPESESNS